MISYFAPTVNVYWWKVLHIMERRRETWDEDLLEVYSVYIQYRRLVHFPQSCCVQDYVDSFDESFWSSYRVAWLENTRGQSALNIYSCGKANSSAASLYYLKEATEQIKATLPSLATLTLLILSEHAVRLLRSESECVPHTWIFSFMKCMYVYYKCACVDPSRIYLFTVQWKESLHYRSNIHVPNRPKEKTCSDRLSYIWA